VYCSNCGTKSTGGNFCSSCGSSLLANATPAADALEQEAAQRALEDNAKKAYAIEIEERKTEVERIRLAEIKAKAAGEAVVARQAAEEKKKLDEAEYARRRIEAKKAKRRARRQKVASWFRGLKPWQKIAAGALMLGLLASATSGVALASEAIGVAVHDYEISSRIHTQQMDFKAYWQDRHAFESATAKAQPVLDQAIALNPVAQAWGDKEEVRARLTENIALMTDAMASRDVRAITNTMRVLNETITDLGTQVDANNRAGARLVEAAKVQAAADAATAEQARIAMKLAAPPIMRDMWSTICETYESMSLYNQFAYYDGADIVWVFSHNPDGNIPEFTLRMQDRGSYWHVFMNGDSAIPNDPFINENAGAVSCPETDFNK
jgi:hypothetical protein